MITRQMGFDFDTQRCVHRYACEIACKSLNQLELGIKWRRMVDIWDERYPQVVSRTMSIACMRYFGSMEVLAEAKGEKASHRILMPFLRSDQRGR